MYQLTYEEAKTILRDAIAPGGEQDLTARLLASPGRMSAIDSSTAGDLPEGDSYADQVLRALLVVRRHNVGQRMVERDLMGILVYLISPIRALAAEARHSGTRIPQISLALDAVFRSSTSTDRVPEPTADHWNACLEVITRPIATLDAIQRPAALVFEYYGRVMNGGHELHFDAHGDSRDPQLLQALQDIGAPRHARILAECYFLRREAKRSRHDAAYASETIVDLDRQFCRLEPDIPELLARYFKSHPESFPV